MGIKVEFNPDFALRDYVEYEEGRRKEEECIPHDLHAKEIYSFLKKGQRNYFLEGEVPLLITKGSEDLSLPIASIEILESIHFTNTAGEVWTKGTYRVKEVFNDSATHFNGFTKVWL